MNQLVGAVESAQPPIRGGDGGDFEIFDDVRNVHATTDPTEDEVENSAHLLTRMENLAVIPPKSRNFTDHEPRQRPLCRSFFPLRVPN